MPELTNFPHLEEGEQDPALPDGWIVARDERPFIWKREIRGVTLLVVQTEENTYEPQLAFCNEVLQSYDVHEHAALQAEESAFERLFGVLKLLNGEHDLEAYP